jgi:hypothetical protein
MPHTHLNTTDTSVSTATALPLPQHGRLATAASNRSPAGTNSLPGPVALMAQEAAARLALPLPARREAARAMYRESLAAGAPCTDQQLGAAFGLSDRWGRDRIAEVRAELAKQRAEPADLANNNTANAEPAKAAEPSPQPGPSQPTAVPAGPAESAAQLARVRWAVRATLSLAVAASTIANILHARDNPISQTIAAWPPLALLAAIELISRVPIHRRTLAALRMVATATIAGIAAYVSYGHMVEVTRRYGEVGASAYLIPLTVDGLIVSASVCLVELSSRIRAATGASQ